MSRAYRALAALLAYPQPELIAGLAQSLEAVPALALPLARELCSQDLLRSQESYVALFDRSRALSLHLFEHVHGDSRDRGQAMVDLHSMYQARGVQLVEGELPDYLPAFLEFLSLLPEEEARRLLGETAHILRALGERLAERASAYAHAFAALLALAGEPALKAAPARARQEDRQALDREWREPEVTFGGPQPVRLYRNGVPA